ncbi:type I restriction-modification system subunit M [Streptomyces bohaiensis]|uniref:site-specific DNA-methyltransferase (adenine-specific) n=1 Tax=Streptomyces bohaiensis TaxID=1431344 RepID=A0ABX1CE66_9ACTN|nr:class I SAM-dependent DNA methyltransferase [Streptomyces bohaiensis]NJQ15687.1 SAM-dependent DNA methyltransferase [Streptomyces bohaiensis]
MSNTNQELADFIWSVADLLRGDYKRSEYAKVILPLTVLRRFDCVMEAKGTRQAVRDRDASYAGEKKDGLLLGISGLPFYNTSKQNFETIGSDDKNVYANLKDYIRGFSSEVTEIIDRYDFHIQIERLKDADLLYLVVQEFAAIDLSPEKVSNHDMGYVFEELIRKFADASNETAGEHFTPREVVKLMVELLLGPDEARIRKPGAVLDILDPACGTGGMLAAAEEHIRKIKPGARINLFGQEINAESYAICRSDMLLKGHKAENIRFGNTFTRDWHEDRRFSYMLANPPFGVEWRKSEKAVREEHEDLGFAGRFGAGLPRINDGSFLFLQHMLHKMQPLKKDENGDEIGGSRIAIVFNGSPLFTGSACSGESEIRRWILENDYLETIVGLSDQLFYNTGISTYFWILSNRKPAHRKGKVVMIDARGEWVKRRKSLGEKRKEIADEQIAGICAIYRDAEHIAQDESHPQHAKVKILRNEAFGYQRITVDRPLKLRFEVTEDTLTALSASAALQKVLGDKTMDPAEVAKRQAAFVAALQPLTGQIWHTKAEAWDALHKAVTSAGLIWPSSAPVQKALREAVGVRDPKGEVQYANAKKNQIEHDPDLRDAENVPMDQDIDDYLAEEVTPHVEDAWIAETKNPKTKLNERSKIGYEIPFTRHFYVYEPPRPLSVIDAELKSLETEIWELLGEVTE